MVTCECAQTTKLETRTRLTITAALCSVQK